MIFRKFPIRPFFFLPVLCGLFLLTSCGPGPTQTMFNNEGESIGIGIGQILNERQSGLKVLVMTRPGLKNKPLDQAEKAIIKGLKNELGSRVKTAEIIPGKDIKGKVKQQGLSGKDYEMALAFEYDIYASGFPLADLLNFMHANQTKADVIVNMIGMPTGMNLENFPQSSELPGLVILNTKYGVATQCLKHKKGWGFLSTRPENAPNEDPEIRSLDVGKFSTLLYPAS